jgi:hypothetical protein
MNILHPVCLSAVPQALHFSVFFCSYFSFLFVCFSGLLFRHPGSKADEPSPPAVTWSPDKGPALIDQKRVVSHHGHVLVAPRDFRMPMSRTSPVRIASAQPQVQVLKSKPPAALSLSLSSPAATSQPPLAARDACTPGPHYRSHAPPVLTTGNLPCGAEFEAPLRLGTCPEPAR